MSRLRWLRWLDALLAWLALVLGVTTLLPELSSTTAMTLAAAVLAVIALVPRLRVAWRPVSGLTTVLVSRGLRAGDRAWFVHGRDVDLVLVTARHGLRIVIAKPDHEARRHGVAG